MPALGQYQTRRDLAANWSNQNPTLQQGEIGFEYDTGRFKIGDGSTAWNSLVYSANPATSGTAYVGWVPVVEVVSPLVMGFQPLVVSQAQVNTQTGTAYTLVLADAGKIIEMNNASANTLTIPLNATVAYPLNTTLQCCQIGAGATSIAGISGVTIITPDSANTGNTIKAQNGTVGLRQRLINTWILSGDI